MIFPLIGIVVPVRNRRDVTVEFVNLFLEQDYPCFKLYIVDSASTDGTSKAIRALQASEVITLQAPPSAYWTAATNIGVRHALADSCEYVVTINDDAIVTRDFLSRIVKSAQDTGERIIGAIISYAEHPAKIWGVGAYNDWASGAFVQTGLANLQEEAIQSSFGCSVGLVSVAYLCGNGVIFHRSVYEKIGLYDERYTPHYHADSELTMRAEQAGIARWASLDVRLYNRFSESDDGAFSTKNSLFFSIRSANYVRPILFIVHRYCPRELAALSIARYFARHMRSMGRRNRSKLLRAIDYMTKPETSPLRMRTFFPPADPDLMLAADLDLLLQMEPRGFVIGAYLYFLHRSCSDQELTIYEKEAGNTCTRSSILREFLSSQEYRELGGTDAAFALALLSGTTLSLTASQLRIITWREAYGRNPTRRELIDPPEYGAQSGTEVKQQVPTVYVNVDVPCIAISDARARTGVHRYVVSIIEAMRIDTRITTKIFCSSELRSQFEALLVERPEWRPLTWDAHGPAPRDGVAFYPYFPFGAKVGSLAHLPQAITLCDLFPLTKPEWFSEDAVTKFRQQLHNLDTFDHVFCISGATESELRRTLPSLKAHSSIAYLAAGEAPAQNLSIRAGIRALKRKFDSPYFVCVGTIEPRKNLHNVISAFQKLCAATTELRMLVVGQQGWSTSAEELLSRGKNIAHRIEFLGRVPDAELWELYLGAVCTVFPSLAEGFGLPILESFQCGTPVVTSNNTSMAEIATKGALLVHPLSPDDIAEAISKIYYDMSLRSKLADEARQRAKEFSWARSANAHIAVFLKLA